MSEPPPKWFFTRSPSKELVNTSRFANRITAGAMAAAIREDGKVLMIRRQKEPYEGLWAVPGGKVEVGEHPDQTVLREFQEETGLTAEIDRFCGCASEIMPGNQHFLLYLFRLRVIGGSQAASTEGPIEWLDPDQLDGVAVPSDIWMLRHMILSTGGPKLVSIQATETSMIIEQQHH